MVTNHKLTVIRRSRSRRKGFSMTELLITVAVLGIMTGIALVSYGRDIWIASREGVHKRNAQALAALSMSATAAGATHIVPGDVIASIRNLSNGVTATRTGSPTPMVFKMKMEDQVTLNGAAYYLEVGEEQLVYHGDRPTPN